MLYVLRLTLSTGWRSVTQGANFVTFVCKVVECPIRYICTFSPMHP